MSKKLIVGTEECPIDQVKKELCSPSALEIVFSKWNAIALHLSLPPEQVQRLQAHEINNDSEKKNLIMEILDIWFEIKARKAPLEDLARALRNSGLDKMADELFETFLPTQSSSRSSNTPGRPINPTGTGSESMTERDITDSPTASSRISDSYPTWVPNSFTKDVIVKTEGSNLSDVILEIYNSDSSHNNNWLKVAHGLHLLPDQIESLKSLLDDKFNRTKLIYDLLSYWIRKSKFPAQLSELLSTLKNNGMNRWAVELESYFCNQYLQQNIIKIQVISVLEKVSCKTVKHKSEVLYFPDKVLGTGFMGSVVFKGKFDPITVSIPVAVKRIDESAGEYISNEIKLLRIIKTIQSPNILNLIGRESRNGFHYLVLELCNANLKDWVEKTEKGMEFQGIADLEILSQCVSGLTYLHEKDVVHRNLKPSKIMLKLARKKVLVKLSGFGLGTCISKGIYTSSGPVGSPGWMDPDVSKSKKGDKINGAKADIFSLGCLFYYVVTRGGHPFGDKDGAFQRMVNIEAGKIKMEQRTEYDCYGMKQLIKLMIVSVPQNRPPLSIVANHPVFWEHYKVTSFFHSIKDSEIFTDVQKLAISNEISGGVGWIEKATKAEFKSTEGYSESIFDLIEAINIYLKESKTTTTQDKKFIKKWLAIFPKLLPCTWVAYLPCKNEEKFQDFYKNININEPFFEQNVISDLK